MLALVIERISMLFCNKIKIRKAKNVGRVSDYFKESVFSASNSGLKPSIRTLNWT